MHCIDGSALELDCAMGCIDGSALELDRVMGCIDGLALELDWVMGYDIGRRTGGVLDGWMDRLYHYRGTLLYMDNNS